MPVTCPHCNTRYVLPAALLGPGGARVRCPRCREPFSVSAEGGVIEPEAPKVAPVENNGTRGPDEAVATGAAFLTSPSVAVAHSAAVAASEPARLPAAEAAPVVATNAVPAPAAEAAPVSPSGAAPARVAESHAKPVAAPPAHAKSATPAEVAVQVLEDLASHSGDALRASRAHGTLFRDFGAVIAEAFEFYRREVGPGADAAPFRNALREKWGVDLEPQPPPSRLG